VFGQLDLFPAALYLILNNVLQMDTIKTSNKGYSAELFVVTFNHVKERMDNGSKVHILLVSFQLRFLHSIPQHTIYASLEQLLSILIQYLRVKYERPIANCNILHRFSSSLLIGCTV
jgi:hypothetical protein